MSWDQKIRGSTYFLTPARKLRNLDSVRGQHLTRVEGRPLWIRGRRMMKLILVVVVVVVFVSCLSIGRTWASAATLSSPLCSSLDTECHHRPSETLVQTTAHDTCSRWSSPSATDAPRTLWTWHRPRLDKQQADTTQLTWSTSIAFRLTQVFKMRVELTSYNAVI